LNHLSRIVLCAAIVGCAIAAAQSESKPLELNASLEGTLAPGQARSYSVALQRGDAALFIVRQIGVDLVVDVTDPSGAVVDSVDSPTGRNGDEVVELRAADSGTYVLTLRSYDEKEPTGRYALHFVSRHDRAQTARVEQEARRWIATRSAGLPADAKVPERSTLPPFERMVDVRVLGLGEATHGNREFGELRLTLTKRLIVRNGFRVVAIEASAARYAMLQPYLRGQVRRTAELTRQVDTGWIWIGRRAQRELVEWVRSWNIRHPRDQVWVVGIDANDNRHAREILGPFLQKAYGDEALKRWKEAERELAAADEQSFVFGDSGVNGPTKQFLLEINAMLDADAALLEARYGAESRATREAARILLEFADFNSSGEGGAITHARDWYMANRVLRALGEAGARAKVVYWAHNSHIAHPKGPSRAAGALLRDVLGCDYAAMAVTFGEGAFLAQVPNDLEDRLLVSSLPPSPDGSLEAMLKRRDDGGSLTAWSCKAKENERPEWFRIPRKMHWIGALYKPGSNPAESFRPFDVLNDFDAVAYLPRVSADEIPTDRPLVPARKR
jgi:erythromycin esterase